MEKVSIWETLKGIAKGTGIAIIILIILITITIITNCINIKYQKTNNYYKTKTK